MNVRNAVLGPRRVDQIVASLSATIKELSEAEIRLRKQQEAHNREAQNKLNLAAEAGEEASRASRVATKLANLLS